MAASLSLSVRSVEWPRCNLMGTLNAHKAPELMHIALQGGLVVEEG